MRGAYEQAAAAWKSVNRTPCWAILSMLGVRISLPKQPMSEKPKSSATTTRKLGRLPIFAISRDAELEAGALHNEAETQLYIAGWNRLSAVGRAATSFMRVLDPPPHRSLVEETVTDGAI